MTEIKQLANKAAHQKTTLLKGGYIAIPNFIYRTLLPELITRYKKTEARDAIILYSYFLTFVCGDKNSDLYMWAYPSVRQINRVTGIHRSRIVLLVNILVTEGLLKVKFISYKGSRKKIYLPLYERKKVKEKKEVNR